MLLKSFINDNELKELLNWINTVSFNIDAVGQYAKFTFIEDLINVPQCVNDIKKRCLNITGKAFHEPVYKDFVNEILPNGYVNLHTDPCPKGFKHLRFNILLQKPEINGNIIHNNKKIILNIKDCFILDTNYLHGLSKVDGNTSYKSIVFGFLIKDE